MYKRLSVATMIASVAALSAPAIAQQQTGLVNVGVGDVSVDLNRIISDNNINVQAPIGAIVQVPIGVAANVCNVSAAVLAQQDATGDAACNATSETASQAELTTLARALQRR
jgi:hypothetical protein